MSKHILNLCHKSLLTTLEKVWFGPEASELEDEPSHVRPHSTERVGHTSCPTSEHRDTPTYSWGHGQQGKGIAYQVLSVTEIW